MVQDKGESVSLLDNPDYVADLTNHEYSNRDIHAIWGYSTSTISEHRNALGFKRATPEKQAKATATSGHSSDEKTQELSEESNGSLKGGIRSHHRLSKTDIEEWLTSLGYNASDYNITVGFSEFRVGGEEAAIWNKVTATPKQKTRNAISGDDAETLASRIVPVPPSGRNIRHSNTSLVVCLSDFQTGKVNKGHGSAELVERFEANLADIVEYVKDMMPSELVIADNGDCIENITSSAPNQAVTNDLSVPDQLRLWQRLFTTAIVSLYPWTQRLIVTGVPSNHAEVRNTQGKVGYGDYGIGVLGSIKDALQILEYGDDIEWVFPENEWDIATFVPVGGGLNAFTHGHHAKRIDNMPQWVANQASGRSRMKDATIVTYGHYHHRDYRWSRGRELVGLPAMEGASDYFENATGEYSIPGILTYQVSDGYTEDMRFWHNPPIVGY